jgi:endoglucanase
MRIANSSFDWAGTILCGAAVAAWWVSRAVGAGAGEVSHDIRFNTVGYQPGAIKQASVVSPPARFRVLSTADHRAVFNGTLSEAVTNADTGEELRTADFSGIKTPGEYVVDVEGLGSSAPFRVGSDVYVEPFRTVTRGMYLWRCGMAVHAGYRGDTFAHAACHTNDGWLDYVGGGHERKDGTGGWHDAGDYNKYVVNAGVTVGSMFRAWEDFGPAIRRVELDLPEKGGRFPGFLAEIKWEIDWLLKMQAEDGSVYHKLSTLNFGGMMLPEKELSDRYFVPASSAATADFVAMTSAAARHFKPFDPGYAERCLAAARTSRAWLLAHPDERRADQRDFRTGGYPTRDPDDRLWAAAEFWETTGDADALKELESRIRESDAKIDVNWDWGNVGNLGLFVYVLSPRPGRNDELVAQAKTNVIAVADKIVAAAAAHGYARPLGTVYFWGCNGTVARQVINLEVARRLTGNATYHAVAADAVNHLLGRNVYGRSFVTGVGFEPPRHPHDRRSVGDAVAAPWPGYLIGGANPRASDWHDTDKDYRTNEIAINWNGALIYALAALLTEAQ